MHKTSLRVRYGETDQMGVVYHAEYLVYCELGRTEFIRDLGFPYAALEQQGVMLAVTEASLRFHAAAKYDDTLAVATTLTSVKSRSLTFDYLITLEPSGKRLVSACTTLTAIDRTGRPTVIPSTMRDLLSRAIASQS